MNDDIGALILGDQPKTAAAPKPVAQRAVPAAQQASLDKDAERILAQELAATQQKMQQGAPAGTKDPAAYMERLQSDFRAIQNELKRLPGYSSKSAPASVSAPAPSPVAAADEIGALILGEQPKGAKPAPVSAPAVPPTAPAAEAGIPAAPSMVSDIGAKLFGGLEAAKSTLGGLVSAVPAGVAGLYKLATTGSPEQAAQAVQQTQATLMRPLLPTTPEGKQYTEAVGKGLEALNIPAEYIGRKALEATGSPMAGTVAEVGLNPLNLLGAGVATRTLRAGRVAPAAAAPEAALPGGARILTPEEARARVMAPQTLPQAQPAVPPTAAVPSATPSVAPVAVSAAVPSGAQFGSAGAAAASKEAQVQAAMQMATPEGRAVLANVNPKNVNLDVLNRHLEADSLPIPIRLTEGQATGDIVKISDEFNRRGKDPQIAFRLKEQNDQLLQNLNAIRDEAAPRVFGTNHVENGQALIDTYKALDEARNQGIRGLYKQLEDAAGGQFPVNGAQFVADADRLLARKLKTEFVPPTIRRQMEQFREGPMTFENFEALRTNLAAEIRKAERTGDGNAEMAASLVRQALENLPMTGEAATKLKPLADQARQAAKERFQLLERDPAYKAAVNDRVSADDFINKFVISGKKSNVQQMVEQFGRGSDAHQLMSAGAINWLRQKAGLIGDAEGNFSQAGYNKALQILEPRINDLMESQTANQLRTLGNVAKYTQEARRGSFQNPSGTAVTLMRAGAGAAERIANIPGMGVVPIGTMTREAIERVAAQRELNKILEPYAGITYKQGK